MFLGFSRNINTISCPFCKFVSSYWGIETIDIERQQLPMNAGSCNFLVVVAVVVGGGGGSGVHVFPFGFTDRTLLFPVLSFV